MKRVSEQVSRPRLQSTTQSKQAASQTEASKLSKVKNNSRKTCALLKSGNGMSTNAKFYLLGYKQTFYVQLRMQDTQLSSTC